MANQLPPGVSSVHVRTAASGIVLLQINTVERGVYYHRYNNTEYLIQEGEKEEQRLTIDPLPLDPSIRYIVSDWQDKDQITFLYIPASMLR